MSLYQLTVPTITRALEALKESLQKADQWADEKHTPHSDLLEARLIEDMEPLTFQVQRATDVAKQALVKVGGFDDIDIDDDEQSFHDLYERIDKALAMLGRAQEDKFVELDTTVECQIEPMDCKFTALTFVQYFVLPNVFFHTTTAYDIVRNAGVPVGKADFLGSKTWKESTVQNTTEEEPEEEEPAFGEEAVDDEPAEVPDETAHQSTPTTDHETCLQIAQGVPEDAHEFPPHIASEIPLQVAQEC